MEQTRTRLAAGGRVVIPAAYRKRLGWREGAELIVVLEGGEIRLLTPRQAVRRVQARVRRYVPPGRSLVGELSAERRAEAERE